MPLILPCDLAENPGLEGGEARSQGGETEEA